MLHTEKQQLVELENIDQQNPNQNTFSYYQKNYQEIIKLIPKDKEDALKLTENLKKENYKKATQIYQDIFKKNEEPYAQYFRLQLNHFKEDSNSLRYYKKLIKQTSAIRFLNYGLAASINPYGNQNKEISCFIMVLLLENDINSALSKEALKHLTKIKDTGYAHVRAAFYLYLFQASNTINKDHFYENYLKNGSDEFIVGFFNSTSKVMPEEARFKLLGLLDAKKKEFFAREKQEKVEEKPEKQEEIQIDKKSEEKQEVSPVATLPTHSMFATNLVDRNDKKRQLKLEIFNKEKAILKMQKEVLKLKAQLLELKNPTQDLRSSAP